MKEIKQSGFTLFGTDISLEVCRDEGYGMLAYKNHGKKDARYIFIAINSLCVPVNWGWTEISLDDVVEVYLRNKKGIDSFADCDWNEETIRNGYPGDINMYVSGGWDIEYDRYSPIRSFFKEVKELLKERKDR